jgi:molybdate transport system substrate-binding protein
MDPAPGLRYIWTDMTLGKSSMHRRPLLAAALLAPILLAPAVSRAQDTPPLTVFAAASLQDALRALEPAWRAAIPGNPPIRISFAASSALARQIEQGAPADLFMSADEPWMDYLAVRGLIVTATRVSPLGNALVLVAPANSPLRDVTLGRGTNLATLLGPGRLATGDPAHVPAGRYAQAALNWMGQWAAIAPRLARADNVRSALLLVERGEAPLGIVYATDALASQGVQVIGTFPGESHPPVTYPFAVTRRAKANPQARAALDFLAGPAAVAQWQRFGFSLRAP